MAVSEDIIGAMRDTWLLMEAARAADNADAYERERRVLAELHKLYEAAAKG